jgi:hypothetical protein
MQLRHNLATTTIIIIIIIIIIKLPNLGHSINAIGPEPHRGGRKREHRSIVFATITHIPPQPCNLLHNQANVPGAHHRQFRHACHRRSTHCLSSAVCQFVAFFVLGWPTASVSGVAWRSLLHTIFFITTTMTMSVTCMLPIKP